MLLQFLLTKFSKSEPVSCLHKVNHVTNYCKKKKKKKQKKKKKKNKKKKKKKLITRKPSTPTQGFSPPIFYGKRPAHEVDA